MTKRNKISDLRKAFILGLATLAIAPGCASMKMPWAKSTLADPPKFAAAASQTKTGITGQLRSMGSAVTSAMGKAKTAVTSTFSSRAATSDPTSLSSMPTNLSPELWVTNGQYNESIGNPTKALDSYTKALEQEPTNLSALLSTARLYGKQAQHQQAAEFFQKAIQIQPDASTYNELALVHQNAGKTIEASTAVQKAIELDPRNERYRNNLASLLVAGGRSDEAVRNLEQVFTPAQANYNVAFMHFSNRNIAGAQQHLQLALNSDPNFAPARELMDKVNGSQTAQTAVATYNVANQIYRTAQTTAGPTQATQVPYQQPPGGAATQPARPFAAGGFPTTGQ